TLWLAVFGFIAFFWVFHGLQVAYGALRLPWLKDFPPASDRECPPITILFAARDEAEKLPSALLTLVELDYPRLEIVAVDDRSEDTTGRILDEFAAKHGRLKSLHVRELPKGWLGKPHALQNGYAASTGEWLLFTDADVRFHADVLRRSITMARRLKVQHLTLLVDMDMRGFWETVLMTFFGMAFHLGNSPASANDPTSTAYIGV